MQAENKNIEIDESNDNKRKRSETSSSSELENSLSVDTNTDKNKKKKSKKMTTIKEKGGKEKGSASTISEENDKIASQLKEMNQKMANVLTKDDKSLKRMMKSIFNDMKEDFLQSVFHRIELLEAKIYEKDKENDKLKSQITELNTDIKTQKDENIKLRQEADKANVKLDGKINQLEQYGRRNNVRIDGIENSNDETPAMTTKLVVQKMNDNIEGLGLQESDIDTAHRIGKEKMGNKRQIIVKFISRMKRDNLMHQKYQLKNTGIYVNEDLTAVNAHVLTCIR